MSTETAIFKSVKLETSDTFLPPWSSLDKGESLTSPFDKKIGCFESQSFKFYHKNTTQLIVE